MKIFAICLLVSGVLLFGFLIMVAYKHPEVKLTIKPIIKTSPYTSYSIN